MTLQPIPIPGQPQKKKPDHLVDLFKVDRNELLDTDDVVSVDIERDILDANEEGTLSDLTEVTDEDIMGDEFYGQSPLAGSAAQRRKQAQQGQAMKRPVYRPAGPFPTQINRVET